MTSTSALSYVIPLANILEQDGLGPEDVIQARIASRAKYGSSTGTRIYAYAAAVADIHRLGLSVRHSPSKVHNLPAQDPRRLIGPAHAEIVGLSAADVMDRADLMDALIDVFYPVPV